MFDIGWTELLVIGIVALIVVGPRDLPGMFRTLGKVTARMKSMAREFQRAMDAAADEAGVKDMASDLKKAANPGKMGLDAVKDAAKTATNWEPPKGSSPTSQVKRSEYTEDRAAAAEKIREASAKAADVADAGAEPTAAPPAEPKPAAPAPNGANPTLAPKEPAPAAKETGS